VIVRRVESETGSFDTAITRLEREIELLLEYRTRLMADVVTGKLDVRAAAGRLPVRPKAEGVAPPEDEEPDREEVLDAQA